MEKFNLTLFISFLNNNVHTQLKLQDKTITCCSTGQLKFKGTTKKGLIAVETIATFIVQKIIQLKKQINFLTIILKGNSLFKKGFLQIITKNEFPVKAIFIQQIFSTTHNGCKLPKKRRK